MKFCRSKRRFSSQAEAEVALEVSRRAAPILGRRLPIRVYQCPKCEGWHLTAQEKRDGERKGRAA